MPTVLCLLLVCAIAFAQAPAARINPTIQEIVSAVSEERITATLKRLEAFGTRHVMSDQSSPEQGIGAAQRWLVKELQSYSPKLQVRTETFDMKKGSGRGAILRDLQLANVVAVLPGEVEPDRYVMIGAHYDSLNLAHKSFSTVDERVVEMAKDGVTEAEARRYLQLVPVFRGPTDNEATAIQKIAPGVTDDGSGTAAVLELARVMSRYKFDKSLVFIAFSAEEVGLEGAKAYVEKHKGEKIEALLNNDIIGSDVSGNGHSASGVVRVFSASPEDSPARSLARYVKEIGERYVPSMKVDLVFRHDRFGRGGDHTPFAQAGLAAVRLTTASEHYGNQHTKTDTFATTSVPYTTRVARINAAVSASLALAPPVPGVRFKFTSGKNKGMEVPLLGRGKSGYDAVLNWEPSAGPDLAGYSVLIRSTLAPFWEREIYVGNVNTFTLADFSIDDVVLGVRAIDRDGNQSLVAAYESPTPATPAKGSSDKQ